MGRAAILWAVILLGGTAYAGAQQDHLSNNVVLIVRHAEKSPTSGRGLTPQGEARAAAYARYFEPFQEGGLRFRPDALYAGADSANSVRPRLTLEPLSKETGLRLDMRFSTKAPAALARALRRESHGAHPLIAWRHGEIPKLIDAFGGSAKTLMPNGVWPDEVYDWVVVLEFDAKGKLVSQRLVHEHLTVAER